MGYKKKYTTVNYYIVAPGRKKLLNAKTLKEARKVVKANYPDALYIFRETLRGNQRRENYYNVGSIFHSIY